MELKLVTYVYTDTDTGIEKQKVVGVFTKEQLPKVFEDIHKIFGVENIIKSFDANEHSSNYFVQYNDSENSHFYSGDYTLGELKI